MRYRLTRATGALAVVGLLLCAVSEARAQGEGVVDLLWSVPPGDIVEGDNFEIGLVARSGTLVSEPFSALEAVLQWDETRVRLLGIDSSHDGYGWLGSDFPESDAGGLNDSFLDGDALYQALGQFTPPLPVATVPGLLVTNFVFKALRPGPAQINLPTELGPFSRTVVLDDQIPGLDILGTTSPGTVNIVPVPEPATAAFLLVLSSGFVWGQQRRRRRWRAVESGGMAGARS